MLTPEVHVHVPAGIMTVSPVEEALTCACTSEVLQVAAVRVICAQALGAQSRNRARSLFIIPHMICECRGDTAATGPKARTEINAAVDAPILELQVLEPLETVIFCMSNPSVKTVLWVSE